MRKHWMYLKYVLRHKWFVLRAGLKIGVPLWMLILHDWDKFLPSEWIPYTNYFYGDNAKSTRGKTGYYKPTVTDDAAFDFAWLLHQKRNKHHWQWWILPEDDGGLKILPMPDVYINEMLADWTGAGLAQGKPDLQGWYKANCDKMQLHPETRAKINTYIWCLVYDIATD